MTAYLFTRRLPYCGSTDVREAEDLPLLTPSQHLAFKLDFELLRVDWIARLELYTTRGLDAVCLSGEDLWTRRSFSLNS